MGNIRTTQLDPTGIVRAVDDQSGAVLGRAVTELGEQVQQVGEQVTRFETRRDTSRLTKEATEAQTRLLKDWNETVRTADPNDKEVANRWMEEVFKPEMEALGADQRITRQARSHLDQLKVGMQSHFDRTTFRDSTNLIGVAAKVNFETMVKELSTSASMDYENVDAYLNMLDAQEEAFIANGGSREVALKMREQARDQIAKGAINGYIDENPEQAKADLDAGTFGDLLTAVEQKQLSKYADSVLKTRDNELRKANADNAAIASSTTLEKFIAGGSPEQLLKEIASNPAYDTPEGANQQRIMFNLLSSEIGRQSTGAAPRPRNNATFDDLMRRSRLPRGHEQRVTRDQILEAVNHGITMSDSNYLLKMIEVGATPEGKAFEKSMTQTLSNIKKQFVGTDLVPILSPANIDAHNEFTLAAQNLILEEWNRGSSTEDIQEKIRRLAGVYHVSIREAGQSRVDWVQNKGETGPASVEDMNKALGE